MKLSGVTLALLPTAAGALLLAGCAHHRGPLNVFESESFTEGVRPVSLNRLMRRCTERYEHVVDDRGLIRILHPEEGVAAETIAEVSRDYTAIFDVASDVLQRTTHAELHIYALPVAEIPESYRFRAIRRGAQWRSAWLSPLLLVDGQRARDRYWDQLGGDAHELAHKLGGLSIHGCAEGNSYVRWLEDGAADLVEAEFGRRRAPASWRREWLAKRDLVAERWPVTSRDVVAWPVIDNGSVSTDTAGREASRYVAAYRLVQAIYDLDDGESLRELLAAAGRRRPATLEQMGSVVSSVLSAKQIRAVGLEGAFDGAREHPDTDGFTSVSAATRELPAVGEPIAPIRVEDAEGRIVVLDRPGRPYLVEFWITRCEPCVKEHPKLVRLQERSEQEGWPFELVSVLEHVTFPEDERRLEAVRMFHRSRRFPRGLPVYTDPDGVGRRLGVSGYPTKLLVRDNRVLWHQIGWGRGGADEVAAAIASAYEER